MSTTEKAKQVQISALVDETDVLELRRSAKENERTFAAEIRRALRYYLEHGQ